jgi:hypothetical protein
MQFYVDGGLAGIRHGLKNIWEPEDGTVIIELDVTYVRKDGSETLLSGHLGHLHRLRPLGRAEDLRGPRSSLRAGLGRWAPPCS